MSNNLSVEKEQGISLITKIVLRGEKMCEFDNWSCKYIYIYAKYWCRKIFKNKIF